jgi:hypothetical protein
LAWTLAGGIFIFLLLELWRPCYFLTDDNLSCGLPMMTEAGRDMKAGHLPFTSDYLFGGGYNFLRDPDTVIWHPFFLLPALLVDTPFRFWVMDIAAFLFLMLTIVGFALLAFTLRKEYSLKIPDGYIVFYTLSFVFSTYILMIGPSWANFLINQSSLPWLVLGILDRRIIRGTLLIFLFTANELLAAYPPLTISTGLCLTLVALGLARERRSALPFWGWGGGNLLALVILSPLLNSMLDGFTQSLRTRGYQMSDLVLNSIPVEVFPSSFFMGNWMQLLAAWHGDKNLASLVFPYVSSILACAAAWCFIPALLRFGASPWRPFDKVCLVLAGLTCILIIRPDWLEMMIYRLPILRSMRWPFREGLQFLFFVHLLLILRFPERIPRWQPALAVFSLMMFLLPLPFGRVPTFNSLALDRELLFSGEAERFWSKVKLQLKPTDQIATIIDWPTWQADNKDIPYTLLGTANFAQFFRVRCASGYSPTAPLDQIPLKTLPYYWFGAFNDNQVDQILAEKPDLRLVRLEGTRPLRITLSNGSAPPIDLSPYMPSEVGGLSGAASGP